MTARNVTYNSGTLLSGLRVIVSPYVPENQIFVYLGTLIVGVSRTRLERLVWRLPFLRQLIWKRQVERAVKAVSRAVRLKAQP